MKNKINYQMVSFLQFIFSRLVIMLHSSRLFQNDAYHFIQKSLFSRMAVPFFIVCSSFFIQAKTSQDPTYPKKYFKNYVKTYLVWSVIFFPYGLFYFYSLSLPSAMIPLGLLVAILYTGMCYHLWYIPAFLTGSYLVNAALKKFHWKIVFFVSFVLFTFGSIETYFAFLKDTPMLSIYSSYTTIFFTSRNGLFFAPVFVCIGHFLYDYKESRLFSQNCFTKLLLAFLLLCLEGLLIFPNEGIDKNFLFTLIPFSMFLFNWAIRTDLFRDQSLYKLKKLSTFYFFIHPIFIELISIPSIAGRFGVASFGWVRFIFTFISTHFLSIIMIQLTRQKEMNSRIKEA